jgi:hypothetical protein
VKDDNDLKRSISEAVKAYQKYVELEVPGRPPAHVTPSGHQPAASSHHPPAHHQQQHAPAKQQPSHGHAQQQHAPPASEGALSFTLPGTGSGDKVKIDAKPEASRYLFVPTPSSHSTRIEVAIPTARQLTFTMTSNVAKLTQTFNLPFDVFHRWSNQMGKHQKAN